jgi:hypothetical protein
MNRMAVVAPVVGGAAGAAVAVAEPFVKAAVDRPVGEIAAKMPLAEDPGAVAVVAENVGHGHFPVTQHVAPVDGAPAAHAMAIAAGHQGGARRTAIRVNVEIREAHSLPREAVHVRRGQDRIAGAGQITVALVVG